MPELTDLVNDFQPEDTEEVEDTQEEEVEAEEEQETEDDTEETEEDSEDETEDDDYTTEPEEEKPVAPPAPTVPEDEAEAKYVLDKLQKISVRIIGADDKVQTVEVYGYGDLPRDYKGIASPYEAGVFQQAVTTQLQKIAQYRTDFKQTQAQESSREWSKREDRAIADDMTFLRNEAVFPKFKGKPNTKEFNESAGAKEFDRVVAFMNERNDEYVKEANAGKAYRHIGFREAFYMLNGPNPRAKDQAEDKARRKVAGKLKSSNGTTAVRGKVAHTRVTNLTDLNEEFMASLGNADA